MKQVEAQAKLASGTSAEKRVADEADLGCPLCSPAESRRAERKQAFYAEAPACQFRYSPRTAVVRRRFSGFLKFDSTKAPKAF